MSYFNMAHYDWIERGCKRVCSPFGREVAYIVGCTFNGIYNAPIEHGEVDWGHKRFMSIIIPQRGLATWDFNQLTRLTLFAHEMCIRVEIQPIVRFFRWNDDDGFGDGEAEYLGTCDRGDELPSDSHWCEPGLRIWFHKRAVREGGMAERHPTIETAIEDFRASYRNVHDFKLEDT